jgi:hypothetical protein
MQQACEGNKSRPSAKYRLENAESMQIGANSGEIFVFARPTCTAEPNSGTKTFLLMAGDGRNGASVREPIEISRQPAT